MVAPVFISGRTNHRALKTQYLYSLIYEYEYAHEQHVGASVMWDLVLFCGLEGRGECAVCGYGVGRVCGGVGVGYMLDPKVAIHSLNPLYV